MSLAKSPDQKSSLDLNRTLWDPEYRDLVKGFLNDAYGQGFLRHMALDTAPAHKTQERSKNGSNILPFPSQSRKSEPP